MKINTLDQAAALRLEGREYCQSAIPLWVYAVSVGSPLLAVALATLGLGIDPNPILKDPAAHTAYPFYLGFFSNMGVLAWWTAAVSCLLAAAALWKQRRPSWQALAFGGTLSALLGLDDLLLFHEEIFPNYFGIPEPIVFFVYGCVVLFYLFRFRGFHLAMDWQLLAAALTFFFVSAFLDLTNVVESPWWGLVLEDGFKFPGACGWATYHAWTAYRQLIEFQGEAAERVSG
jgi:hypothetical protein